MTISRDIDPDILKKIDKQVRRGATLLVEGQQSGHTPEHDLWVETFEGFIAILDPHGEDYGGSLRSRWYLNYALRRGPEEG